VGYSPDEKRRQLEGLLSGFKTLCEEKVRFSQTLHTFYQIAAFFYVLLAQLFTNLGDKRWMRRCRILLVCYRLVPCAVCTCTVPVVAVQMSDGTSLSCCHINRFSRFYSV
jgi:hypothetical protein